MKKVLLSLATIGLFIAYGLHQRDEESHVQVIAPQSTPADTQAPQTPSTSSSQGTPNTSGAYKNGSYTGTVEDAFYGNIQVKAIIQNGKIADVVFLQYPNDRDTSIMINTQAMPYLKQEAIQAQSANVDIVSGATDSSIAFRRSLAQALSKAQ